jgi:hypothetical protein
VAYGVLYRVATHFLGASRTAPIRGNPTSNSCPPFESTRRGHASPCTAQPFQRGYDGNTFVGWGSVKSGRDGWWWVAIETRWVATAVSKAASGSLTLGPHGLPGGGSSGGRSNCIDIPARSLHLINEAQRKLLVYILANTLH